MSILVFGRTGQVARELAAQASVVSLGRDDADLGDPQACVAVLESQSPTAVINAAAYTGVDKAEDQEASATVINGDTPTALARACATLDIPFVHISTDYVFDGKGHTAWGVGATPGPVGAYGRSKLVGEEGVRAAGGRYAILRTSWVFSSHGNNFVKTMLRLSASHSELKVVADQIGGPTPAKSIAKACLAIVEQLGRNASLAGTYHFSGAPDTSWADFARAVFEEAGHTTTVHDIATSEYPTPAIRPLNSRLDCSETEAIFGISRPDWQAELKEVLLQLKNKDRKK